jgi:hypothetical protein
MPNLTLFLFIIFFSLIVILFFIIPPFLAIKSFDKKTPNKILKKNYFIAFIIIIAIISISDISKIETWIGILLSFMLVIVTNSKFVKTKLTENRIKSSLAPIQIWSWLIIILTFLLLLFLVKPDLLY